MNSKAPTETPLFNCKHCGDLSCYVILDGDYVFNSVAVPCHSCNETNRVRVTVESLGEEL